MLTKQDHLLFIAPTAYPLGGVAVWLDYLMKGLELKQGAQITFGAVSGTFHDSDEYLKRYPFSNTEIISRGTGSAVARVNSIIGVIERIKPTMVICANIPDVYRATRLLKSRKTIGYKLVATVHGLVARLFADMVEYDDVLDHIVVTNQLTRAMILEMTNYSDARVHYAPYGVTVPDFAADLNVDNRLEGEVSRPLRVLYCGRIDKDQKRCQDLLAIKAYWDSIKFNYELIIAGDGPYRRELITKLGTQRVTYLGAIPAEYVSKQAYQQSDVLLVTSDWETGPIVIWEALAHGLPVVTSQYSGVQAEGSLVHGVNCLMFDIGDTEAAAKAVLQLEDASVLKRLQNGGLNLIRSRYTRTRSIEKWVAVFNKIARSNQGVESKPIKPVEFVSRGRLDRILGCRIAECVRRWGKLSVLINDAGDEWPHAHTVGDAEFNARFAERIRTIDISHSGNFSHREKSSGLGMSGSAASSGDRGVRQGD